MLMIDDRCKAMTLGLLVLLFGANVQGSKTAIFNEKFKSNPKLNILVIVGRKFPVMSHTFVLNQIKGLLDRGHDLTVHTKKLMPDCQSKEVIDLFEKYHLKDKVKVGPTPSNLDDYDIVLCQFGMLGTRLAQLKKRQNFKAKLVTCFRGADLSVQVRYSIKSYNTLVEHGDYFLPVCEHFAKRLVFLGCDPQKVSIMYSGIELDNFSYKKRTMPDNGPINITSVSRLVPKKGIDDAIRAVVYAHNQFPAIKYKIVGCGREEDHLKALVKHLDAQDYISFVGQQSHDQVIKILDETHVFVLPSRTAPNGDQEGIPNAVKEAMLCGIPTLTTLHSGIPELVEDGVNGFMVQEGCPEQLGKKLITILQQHEQWESIGLAARNRVATMFDNEKLCEQLEAKLIDLVHQKSPNGLGMLLVDDSKRLCDVTKELTPLYKLHA